MKWKILLGSQLDCGVTDDCERLLRGVVEEERFDEETIKESIILIKSIQNVKQILAAMVFRDALKARVSSEKLNTITQSILSSLLTSSDYLPITIPLSIKSGGVIHSCIQNWIFSERLIPHSDPSSYLFLYKIVRCMNVKVDPSNHTTEFYISILRDVVNNSGDYQRGGSLLSSEEIQKTIKKNQLKEGYISQYKEYIEKCAEHIYVTSLSQPVLCEFISQAKLHQDYSPSLDYQQSPESENLGSGGGCLHSVIGCWLQIRTPTELFQSDPELRFSDGDQSDSVIVNSEFEVFHATEDEMRNIPFPEDFSINPQYWYGAILGNVYIEVAADNKHLQTCSHESGLWRVRSFVRQQYERSNGFGVLVRLFNRISTLGISDDDCSLLREIMSKITSDKSFPNFTQKLLSYLLKCNSSQLLDRRVVSLITVSGLSVTEMCRFWSTFTDLSYGSVGLLISFLGLLKSELIIPNSELSSSCLEFLQATSSHLFDDSSQPALIKLIGNSAQNSFNGNWLWSGPSPGIPFGNDEQMKIIQIDGYQVNILLGSNNYMIPGYRDVGKVEYVNGIVIISFNGLTIKITPSSSSSNICNASWTRLSESDKSTLVRVSQSTITPTITPDISNVLWMASVEDNNVDDQLPLSVVGLFVSSVDQFSCQSEGSPKSSSCKEEICRSHVLIKNFYETDFDDIFIPCEMESIVESPNFSKPEKVISEIIFSGSVVLSHPSKSPRKISFKITTEIPVDNKIKTHIEIDDGGTILQRELTLHPRQDISPDPNDYVGYNAIANMISNSRGVQDAGIGLLLQASNAPSVIKELLPGTGANSSKRKTTVQLLPGIYKMFNGVCEMLFKHPSFSETIKLDNWIFKTKSSFNSANLFHSSLAKQIIAHHYCLVRVVGYNSPPLCGNGNGDFILPDWYTNKTTESINQIRKNIKDNNISRRDLQRILKRIDDWNRICDSSFEESVSLALKMFDAALEKLMKQKKVINDLLLKWEIGETAKSAGSILDSVIRGKEDVLLCRMLDESVRLSSVLSDILDYDSIILRYQFSIVHKEREGDIALDHKFPSLLSRATDRIKSFTPKSTCLEVLTQVISSSELSSIREEQSLLEHLDISPEVTNLIVNGAIPLSCMVSDLEAFRLLINTDHVDLQIQSNLRESAPEILLDANLLEKVSLEDAENHVILINKHTTGCDQRVLRILKVIAENCIDLIRFIRCNPEAQDRGVASVLWNNGDAKHVTLQSFLDCCGYINPVLAVTQKQSDLFEEGGNVVVRTPIKTFSEFWEAMLTAVGACKSRADNFITAVETMLIETSKEDKIQELREILSDQHGSTDQLLRTIDKVIESGALISIDVPPLGTPTLSVTIPSLNISKTSTANQNHTLSLSQYQDLICRAALHQDLLETLPIFLSEARDVLLCYNSICQLAAEGHLSYRATVIKIPHNIGVDHEHHFSKLQKLYGSWKKIFAHACNKYPITGTLSSTELTRLVKYYRDVYTSIECADTTSGEVLAIDSVLYAEKGIIADHISPISEVSDSLLLPERIVPLTTKCRSSSHVDISSYQNVISINGLSFGDSAGKYRSGPMVYRNVANPSIVLTQTNFAGGGWCCFDTSRNEILLSSAKRGENNRPWEAVDWSEPLYSSVMSYGITVLPNDSEITIQSWSQIDTTTTRDTTLVVGVGEDNRIMTGLEHKKVGSHLYIVSTTPYSLWHAAGLEAGMRVIGVNNDRGDASTLQELLSLALKINRPIALLVIPAWVWSVVTSGVDITASGNGVIRISSKKSDPKQKSNNQQRAIAISPAEGLVWQVLVTGDVFGFRAGLCTSECLQAHGSLSTLSSLATTSNSSVYWLLRSGILRHNGVDIQTSIAVKSGDIITVERCLLAKTISFYVNGVRIPQCFENVPSQKLHPICCLIKKGCKVELSQAKPTVDNHQWSEERRHYSTALSDCNKTATRVPSESGTYSVVTGDNFFEGPGPHRFDIIIMGKQIADCLVGLIPTDTRLDRQMDPQSASVGILLRPDGTLVSSRESKVLHSLSMNKKRVAQGDILTFIVHLGLPSLEIRKNNEVVYNTILTDSTSVPKLRSPLVPCCVLANSETSVSFLNVPGVRENVFLDIPVSMLRNSSANQGRARASPELVEEPEHVVVENEPPATSASPSAVIQGAQYSPSANGVYESLPDRYFIHENNSHVIAFDEISSRWVLSTVNGNVISASGCCSVNTPPTDDELRWLSFSKQIPSIYPKEIILTLPQTDSIVFIMSTESDDRSVTYHCASSSFSKTRLVLCRNSDTGCWVIHDNKNITSGVHNPMFKARFPTIAPQLCECWGFGNGSTFIFDDRIVLSGSRIESRQPKQLDRVRHNISVVGHCNTEYALKRLININNKPPTSLSVYHILRSISRNFSDSEKSIEAMFTELCSCGQPDLSLSRLGSFIDDKCRDDEDGGLNLNFIKSAMNSSQDLPVQLPYQHIQSSRVTQFVVRLGSLKPVDQKIFIYTTFNPTGPAHKYLSSATYLECYAGISEMEVYRFLSLYDTIRCGRMVISAPQKLSSELYGLVRSKAATSEKNFYEGKENKQLLVIVTGPIDDETIPNLDAGVCDIRWRRSSCDQLVKFVRFQSVTFYDHPHGTGKTFALEAKRTAMLNLKKSEDQHHCPISFILDLDSTTTDTELICLRLLNPFCYKSGVLTINVACDTPKWLSHVVLDSLTLLGKLCSPSGVSVCTPTDWDLLVEFEDGGDIQKDEYVLTSCRGLAERGKLLPFEITSNGDAPEPVLQFLRGGREVLPDNDLDILKMIASGVSEVPDTNNPDELEEFQRKISKRGTSRISNRILKFLRKKWNTYITSKGFGEPDLDRLVAQCMKHESTHLIYPELKDHFHLTTTDTIRTIRIQLSGDMPPSIKLAIDSYLEYITRLTNNTQQPRHRSLEVSSAQPLHTLIAVLAEVIGIRTKICMKLLVDSGYILISGYLQKLIQIHTHITLRDPIILAGASGTGKTSAVNLLAQFLQAPLGVAGASPLYSLYHFIRHDSKLKNLFPNGISDMVDDRENVLWHAECRFGYDAVIDCIKVLRKDENVVAIQVLCMSIADTIGPIIRNETSNPEIAVARSKSQDLREAIDIVLQTNRDDCGSCTTKAGVLKDALHLFTKEISKIGGGYLSQQLTACLEKSIRSEAMENLVGKMTSSLMCQILAKDHRKDSILEWAGDAVGRSMTLLPNNGKILTSLVREHIRSHIKEHPILLPSKKLLTMLATGDPGGHPSGDQLSSVIQEYLDNTVNTPVFVSVLVKYGMTASDLYDALEPTFIKAHSCPAVSFVVMLDELNATHMLGLVKRIIVDRRWAAWPHDNLPPNISFVGAINPSEAFDGKKLPPSLAHHVVPWDHLNTDLQLLFVSRLVASNRVLYRHHVQPAYVSLFGKIIIHAHGAATGLLQEAGLQGVSQRDVNRIIKVFEYFFERFPNSNFPIKDDDETVIEKTHLRALSALLLGISVCFYFRLPQRYRLRFSESLTEFVNDSYKKEDACSPFKKDKSFFNLTHLINEAINHYCDPKYLHLPEAVCRHQSLLEILFIQMISLELRLAVILCGPPGTSKTLSNNILKVNMTGRAPFWDTLCSISEICIYQGSSQSSGLEVRRKCQEALAAQRLYDHLGHSSKRCLLFIDEAGLATSTQKWALKSLHSYLEGGEIASVLITNQVLDPAITNRCLEITLEDPNPEDLAQICFGILGVGSKKSDSSNIHSVVVQSCLAFQRIVQLSAHNSWWFGLRDLFHYMRFLRRRSTSRLEDQDPLMFTVQDVALGIQRNFNGKKKIFSEVVSVFGDTLSQDPSLENFSTTSIRSELLSNDIDVVLSSIGDSNRSIASQSTRNLNLNDLWVRFKLITDNTPDGNILQILRHANIHEFHDIKVISLSALSSKDPLQPVTVIGSITAAMEAGKFIWLTNTRKLDTALFDMLNQCYIVATNSAGETVHHSAVAIGPTLQYKHIHTRFQCIIHVTAEEVNQGSKLLTSPFLNRLEKFSLGIDDVLQRCIERLSEPEQDQVVGYQSRLRSFAKCLLGSDPDYSEQLEGTVSSVIVESITHLMIRDIPPNKMIRRAIEGQSTFPDEYISWLQNFYHITWRSILLRFLQVVPPASMLANQHKLINGPSGYLLAYYMIYKNWKFSRIIKYVIDSVAAANMAVESGSLHGSNYSVNSSRSRWMKTIIYMPGNTDLSSIIKPIPNHQSISIDTLLNTERGLEVFQEQVHKFCSDPVIHTLLVVFGVKSQGHPEIREVRSILEYHCGTGPSRKMCKAVVLIQPFSYEILSPAVGARFASGWDVYFSDASAEKFKMQRFAPQAILPMTVTPNPTELSWEKVFEYLLSSAVKLNWEITPTSSDVAVSPLYDETVAFPVRIRAAMSLFDACPVVKSTLVKLYSERLPTNSEMVELAADVASNYHIRAREDKVSITQLLIDEESRAAVGLLALSLKILLHDGNADALLANSGQSLGDTLVAGVLSHIIVDGQQTFQSLRKNHVALLDGIFVSDSGGLNIRGVPPKLPGSAALIWLLQVPNNSPKLSPPSVHDWLLKKCCSGKLIEEMVDNINSSREVLDYFIYDFVGRLVSHPSSVVVKNVTPVVIALLVRLHDKYFSECSVLSIIATQIFFDDILRETVAVLIPIGVGDFLDDGCENKITDDMTPKKLSKNFCSNIIIGKLKQFLIDGQSFSSASANNFKVSISSILHLHDSQEIYSSQSLLLLKVILYIFCQPVTKSHNQLLQATKLFVNRSLNNNSICTETLLPLMKGTFEPLLEPWIVGEIAIFLCGFENHVRLTQAIAVSSSVLELVLGTIKSGVIQRGAACSCFTAIMKECTFEFENVISESICKIEADSIDDIFPSGSPTRFQLPSESYLYMAACDYYVDSLVGITSDVSLSEKSLVAMVDKYIEIENIIDDDQVLSSHRKFLYCCQLNAIGFFVLKCLASLVASNSQVSKISTKKTKKVIKSLIEPSGYKCPNPNSTIEIVTVPVDEVVERNISILLLHIESLTGTMDMLTLLRSFVNESTAGSVETHPVVELCGEYLKQKCINAQPLTTKPGDLPFVYMLTSDLHEPYLALKKQLSQIADGIVSPQSLSNLISDFTSGKIISEGRNVILTLEHISLLLYFCVLRFYLREQIVFGGDNEDVRKTVISDLSETLQLNSAQTRLLTVSLNYKILLDDPESDMGIVSELLDCNSNWSEFACSVWAVGASMPHSFMGSLLMNPDAQKGNYLPGDKTGVAISQGGCFKFDCVTQLDEKGVIDSCARGQANLNTGSCYLLWGVQFTALALNLLIFPSNFDTLWNWYFSTILQSKTFGYQRGISNRHHLINQLTERSIAYHLHMGTNTGLSIDEAQRMFAFFLNNLLTDAPETTLLSITTFPTHQDAAEVEKQIENYWVRMTTTDRVVLSKPPSDMCLTLKQLSNWSETNKPYLPSTTVIGKQISNFPQHLRKKVVLAEICIHHENTLKLTIPLILALYKFASKVYSLLGKVVPKGWNSNSITSTVTRIAGSEEGAIAAEELRNIKLLWNSYIEKIGALDYECEEGGLNVILSDDDSLIDVIEFWIIGGSDLPSNANLCRAALHALIQKYNTIVTQLRGTSNFNVIDDISLQLLPNSECGMQLRPLQIAETLCRSHTTASRYTDWLAIEEVLALHTGLLIPKLQLPKFLPFIFRPPAPGVPLVEAEFRAEKLIKSCPEGLRTPIPIGYDSQLEVASYGFTGEQLSSLLCVINSIVESSDNNINDELYPLLFQGLEAADSKGFSDTAAIPELKICHCQGLLEMFVSKSNSLSWITDLKPVPEMYCVELSSSQEQQIRERYSESDNTVIETVCSILIKVLEHCEFLDVGFTVENFISTVIGDTNTAVSNLSINVKHTVCLLKLIRLIQKERLSNPQLSDSQPNQQYWTSFESEIDLATSAVPTLHYEVELSAVSGIQFDSDMRIISFPRSTKRPSRIDVGMRVVAVEGITVDTPETFHRLLSEESGSPRNVVSISVATPRNADGELCEPRNPSSWGDDLESSGTDEELMSPEAAPLPRTFSARMASFRNRYMVSGDPETLLKKKEELRQKIVSLTAQLHQKEQLLSLNSRQCSDYQQQVTRIKESLQESSS